MLKFNEIKKRNKIPEDLPFIKHDLELRDYQLKISKECVNKNSLVVLPTGLGKTVIAIIVAAKTLEKYPPDSKIIALAPSRPLINQHHESFMKFLDFSDEKFKILTGKTAPEKRCFLFNNSQFLFFTPQTLRNDLVNRRYSLKSACLMIFDECHHAFGDYPYTLIADEYIDQNPDGTILALTASPGASKEKIIELCQNLHIPLKNIHIRTRDDQDVKSYLKELNIRRIGVNLTDFMDNLRGVFKLIIEERLKYLVHLKFLDGKAENIFDTVIRKDLIKLNSSLVKKINSAQDKTGLYSAISITAQALIVYHMIELVEQQGLDILLIYMQKMNRDAKKKNSSKAIKILASDHRLRQIYIELNKINQTAPEHLIHPKYAVLEQLISNQLNLNINSRILVFVKLRDSVKSIVDKLENNNLVKPVRFVGQTSKSKNDKGLRQKDQIEILQLFKEGYYNTLVSTNVGEEGLDIAECDLVIFYDVVASEIRLIQRKGRTARHKAGKVIILYCKGTNEEKYLHIALRKLKRMNYNLRSPNKLQKFVKNQYYVQKDTPVENVDNAKSLNNQDIRNYLIHEEKRDKQTNLPMFINNIKANKAAKILEDKKSIKISISIPMRLGLRKRLSREGIIFETTQSNLHVVLFNKVVIQIYNAQDFSDKIMEEIKNFNDEVRNKYQLIIIIIDFIRFRENYNGEKRLLKAKMQKFGNKINLRLIHIDNSEELFFIIKSIMAQNKVKNQKDG